MIADQLRKDVISTERAAGVAEVWRGLPADPSRQPDYLGARRAPAEGIAADAVPGCWRRVPANQQRISRRLRITPTMPAKPVAIKPSVPGSGVTAGGVPAVNVPLTN